MAFSGCAQLPLRCSFPKPKRSCLNHGAFARDGLGENKELLRGEIKSQLPSATIRTEILQMVIKREEEEPPGPLARSRCCSVCCATGKSGVTPLKRANGVPQTQSTLQGENQTAVICESLLALRFSLCGLVFFVCVVIVFYELLFSCRLGQSNPLAQLQEQFLQLRLL